MDMALRLLVTFLNRMKFFCKIFKRIFFVTLTMLNRILDTSMSSMREITYLYFIGELSLYYIIEYISYWKLLMKIFLI